MPPDVPATDPASASGLSPDVPAESRHDLEVEILEECIRRWDASIRRIRTAAEAAVGFLPPALERMGESRVLLAAVMAAAASRLPSFPPPPTFLAPVAANGTAAVPSAESPLHRLSLDAARSAQAVADGFEDVRRSGPFDSALGFVSETATRLATLAPTGGSPPTRSPLPAASGSPPPAIPEKPRLDEFQDFVSNVAETLSSVLGVAAQPAQPGDGARATSTLSIEPVAEVEREARISRRPRTRAVVGGAAAPRTGPLRVFLADRDESYRSNLARNLQARGVEVVEFASGVELSAHAAREQPDLVVTETDLAEMDGFQVFTRLQERSGDTARVVFVTRFEHPRVAEIVKARGAVDYIGKGGSLDSLALRILSYVLEPDPLLAFDQAGAQAAAPTEKARESSAEAPSVASAAPLISSENPPPEVASPRKGSSLSRFLKRSKEEAASARHSPR